MKIKPTSFEPIVSRLLCEYISHPQAVEVNAEITGRTVQVFLRVHGGDRGKVIGKNRQNLSALETLVNAAAQRFGYRGEIKLLDSTVGKNGGTDAFVKNPNWANDRPIAGGLKLAVEFVTGQSGVEVRYKLEDFEPEKIGMFYVETKEPVKPAIEVALSNLVRAMGRKQGTDLGVKIQQV